ncbi:energy transducer TonB [Tenacibaculum sp. nBUS_03]|uniref:energy transducer TonB n=1 Tax=Tenacibaculum sp. nBUS_03 TaxID=3395320 RepID=UPI003EC0F056
MKKILLIVILLIFQQSFTQQVCLNTEKADYEDGNSISINKCNIKNTSKKNVTNNKTLRVNKYRYLKKRLKKNGFIKTQDLHKKTTKVGEVFEYSEIKLVKEKVNTMISLIDKEENIKVVAFNEVTEIPNFVKCKMENEECFNESMKLHIEKNFSYPKEAIKKGIEGDLFISFVIGCDGNVENIKVSSSKEMTILNNEAIRIVSLLPKFNPGKQNGHVTAVSYSFPMNFRLN